MDYETKDELSDYLKGNYRVFDRFTFDCLFKKLLMDGYSNEQAKDLILFNFELSLLVIQERLDNGYYLEIKADDNMAPDILNLYREALIKVLAEND
jgi:hypothetical protein